MQEVLMLTVLASIYVKSGNLDEFLKIFKANVPNVRAEKGCISYTPMIDFESKLAPQEMNENLVTIVEQWEDLAALNDHLAANHMLEYKENVKNIVERVTLKVLQDA
jgi:quinol monooxygenase YgiN